jgi:hypothetical protein
MSKPMPRKLLEQLCKTRQDLYSMYRCLAYMPNWQIRGRIVLAHLEMKQPVPQLKRLRRRTLVDMAAGLWIRGWIKLRVW